MIRVSVKGLIVQNGQVLVLENRAGNLFYTLPGGELISIGPIPDKDQIGLAWLPLKTLHEYPLFPEQIITPCSWRRRAEKPYPFIWATLTELL